MALSYAAVRQATSTGKDYTLGDIDGLSLAVTASGGRSWHFRYCWNGKQKRMSLDTYPAWQRTPVLLAAGDRCNHVDSGAVSAGLPLAGP